MQARELLAYGPMSADNKGPRARARGRDVSTRLRGGHHIEDARDSGSRLWTPAKKLSEGNYQDTSDSSAPHKTNVIEIKTDGHVSPWSLGVERVRRVWALHRSLDQDTCSGRVAGRLGPKDCMNLRVLQVFFLVLILIKCPRVYLQRPEDVRSPEAGATGGCELPDEGAGNSALVPLQKQ